MKNWQISRDGKVLYTADTETLAWQWLLSYQPASIDHACKYEGYKIEEVDRHLLINADKS